MTRKKARWKQSSELGASTQGTKIGVFAEGKLPREIERCGHCSPYPLEPECIIDEASTSKAHMIPDISLMKRNHHLGHHL